MLSAQTAARLCVAKNVAVPVFIFSHGWRDLGIDLVKEFEPRPDGKIRKSHVPIFALASGAGKHVLPTHLVKPLRKCYNQP